MADQRILNNINETHLEKLQEAGVVGNSVTLADFGNFVISPELLKDIEGHRSDFSKFIGALDWKETLSLQMAWLKRSGDISMTEVETCDDGANGNLKPISDYSAGINTSNLHELAAVTPVCNAATRFLAADLLGDVAGGYRNDYDRKRAQLAIARFQQAVNTTGNTIQYGTTTDVASLKSFVDTWSLAAEEIMGGTFIFSQATYGELVRRMVGAGISGPMAGIFTTGDQPMILGRPYIVVPNELLPTLNTATTKSFTVEGASVTINQAVFYADLSTFTGRTSGGLMYDLSTEAAYEEASVVKSAFQRNELVLRGSFFRGGAVKDDSLVVGLGAPGLS
jgi:HK97 family phage major capsid protein